MKLYKAISTSSFWYQFIKGGGKQSKVISVNNVDVDGSEGEGEIL